ncbi:MAG: beta-N-acetylhexosaminidase [Rhodospirillales bacterium]|nr:beta-N-acetylhexosaminidase [Rhodospirillales bacterium]
MCSAPIWATRASSSACAQDRWPIRKPPRPCARRSPSASKGAWLSKSSRPPRALILGLAGTTLLETERRLFAEADPLGFILFARNVDSPAQVRALCGQLRECVGRADAPILIDQEGGRVQRLKPPHWRAAPPAARFGDLYRQEPEQARQAARINARLLAEELRPLGLDVDCAPVLDVPIVGAHDVIGDRAFGADPTLVADLGRAAVEGFLEGGVMPIVKHIPGHGRARVDSHHALPVVYTARAELERTDFAPFRALADAPWAMTAHVVYAAIDPDRPATSSPEVIDEIIRGWIGFKGLLLSDDLSMKALSGDLGERARAALAAGCDVALHCNGDLAEMQAVIGAASRMGEAALEKFNNARNKLNQNPVLVSAAEKAILPQAGPA